MKRVSVITVNYNQPSVTEELLVSILSKNTYPELEIIVVDNGSAEDKTSHWRQQYPFVKFIRSEVNLGFAGGNNLGIRNATGDYLFLVNNDTEFTEKLVKTLVETLDTHPRVAVVSPKIRYFQQCDVIQYVGFTPMNMYTAQNASPGQFEKDTGQYDNLVQPTGFAHGAAMMIRKEAINKVGLMAENFFLYYEEMDWCERFKRAGYEIWVNTNALIYHKESVSVGQKSALKEYFMNRNRILFIRRNAPLPARLVFYLHFSLLVTPRNILNYVKDKQSGFAGWLFKGIWWNITHPKNSTKLGYPLNTIK
jgi:GT2 family glycosyltransferase